MRLTFLGTSAGMPTRQRYMSAVALRRDQARDWYLVDCGDATQLRVIDAGLSLTRLSHVFVTHLHGDHTFGLPGLLSTRGLLRGTDPIVVHGPVGVREFIETSLRLSHCRCAALRCDELPADGGTREIDGIRVEAVPLSHDVTSFAWVFREGPRPGRFDRDRARELGLSPGPDYQALVAGQTVTTPAGRPVRPADVIGPARPGRVVCIAGDNDRPELLIEPLREADLLVHEATHTEEVRANLSWTSRHSTAESTARAAAAAGVRHLILTHFSPRYASEQAPVAQTLAELRQEAQAVYGGRLYLAADLDTYRLDVEGALHVVDALAD